MSRRSKRYNLIQAFWKEVTPESKQDLEVIYCKINMFHYIQKIFHSPGCRALQTLLRQDFPLLNAVFGPPLCTLQSPTDPSVEKQPPILYVGLYACLQQQKKELDELILGLQRALVYARMRQQNPNRNVLISFLAEETTKNPQLD